MIRIYHGQQYERHGTVPHVRKDGTQTQLHRWATLCAHCGEPFFVLTPATAAKFQPNRRCQKHKRPGHKVRSAQS